MFSKMIYYFTRFELYMWIGSIIVITVAFVIFDRVNYFVLLASLIGVTSLTLNAKGNPFGQLLTIIFSIFYGVISYKASYYGEMITYLGMTAPMALYAMISWLKHTTKENSLEVEVRKMNLKDIHIMLLLTVIVTILFYFVLKYFHTMNLPLSTLSVATSFLAVYMTSLRSPYYAIGYAANDVVLIILWLFMLPSSQSALSMVLCFSAFLVNDLYGFINWNKMYHRQMIHTESISYE